MRLLTASLLFIFSINTTMAQTVNSSLGYSAILPDDWTLLTREKVSNTPELFKHEHMEGLSDELWNQVKLMIQSGQVELFLRPSPTGQIMDNINVFLQDIVIPTNREQLDQLCQLLPTEFSKAFNRTVTVYQCELRPVRGVTSLYINFDGALVGTRSLQYQIPKQDQRSFIFTATTSENTLKSMVADFNNMIQSIEQH